MGMSDNTDPTRLVIAQQKGGGGETRMPSTSVARSRRAVVDEMTVMLR